MVHHTIPFVYCNVLLTFGNSIVRCLVKIWNILQRSLFTRIWEKLTFSRNASSFYSSVFDNRQLFQLICSLLLTWILINKTKFFIVWNSKRAMGQILGESSCASMFSKYHHMLLYLQLFTLKMIITITTGMLFIRIIHNSCLRIFNCVVHFYSDHQIVFFTLRYHL